MDCTFNGLTVDRVAIPLNCDLLQNCLAEGRLNLDENDLLEKIHAFSTNLRQIIVRQKVPVQVVEASVHHLCVNIEIVPDFSCCLE